MNEVRFIVFCNGRKCHRSTFGACKLRDMGIPRENVYVMLGGFPEWKDAGYPTK
jgi:rhodanese-related sulfurtransferase